MTYAELLQAIQDYTQSSETTFVASIPSFVKQAEQRIYRSVMIPELRKNSTAATSQGSKYIARPDDFLSVFSLAVVDAAGAYAYLLEKDVAFIREAYPSPATQGLPKYYGIFDGDVTAANSQGNFIVGPTPSGVFTVELHYYYDPVSIVTSSTSWLGTNAEGVLLYGALIEAYTYLKGEADLIALYDKRYNEAMGLLSGIDVRTKRDNYRDGRL
jgi:hypothetical protein